MDDPRKLHLLRGAAVGVRRDSPGVLACGHVSQVSHLSSEKHSYLEVLDDAMTHTQASSIVKYGHFG